MKHKINRTCQTALLLILGLIHGPAQSETLTTLRGISPLEVDQPLAVDSVDQKGNSFNHERLLKLKLTRASGLYSRPQGACAEEEKVKPHMRGKGEDADAAEVRKAVKVRR